jgi:hypothetical protein
MAVAARGEAKARAVLTEASLSMKVMKAARDLMAIRLSTVRGMIWLYDSFKKAGTSTKTLAARGPLEEHVRVSLIFVILQAIEFGCIPARLHNISPTTKWKDTATRGLSS